MKHKRYLATIAAMAAFGVIASSYAAMNEENDALGITTAKLSLVDAITSAEKYVGGVASRAEYEQEEGQGVFEVEVVNGTSVTDVVVNAQNGKVIAAHDDINDRANDHDEDED